MPGAHPCVATTGEPRASVTIFVSAAGCRPCRLWRLPTFHAATERCVPIQTCRLAEWRIKEKFTCLGHYFESGVFRFCAVMRSEQRPPNVALRSSSRWSHVSAWRTSTARRLGKTLDNVLAASSVSDANARKKKSRGNRWLETSAASVEVGQVDRRAWPTRRHGRFDPSFACKKWQ